MKRHLACSLVLTFGAACSPGAPPASHVTAPSPTSPSLSSPTARSISPSVPKNFRAHLSGDQIVPALPMATLAQGQAIFQLNPDGTELSVRVLASNIENVVGAHIHLAAEGFRGPLIALLVSPIPAGGGRSDGVLAHGTITAANLFGPLAGQPLSALIDAIEAGNAYVDIPTNDGVVPINTGPGDYPAGELRGQVQ
jgi:hypothetical protein